ncbi:MAG: hypothetical protein IKI37_07145 [Oscillospiraceae bacterium]|nr:hypothetical protein [Oscillospiraceae bacterium]
MIKIKQALPYLMTVLLIGLMTECSALLHNPEIIFPEMAAIAIGSLCAPKFAWNTSKFKILFFICVCAVTGIGIVKFLSVPFALQLCTAFLTAQMLFIFSKTSFAPMISAIVLPVMLQTDSVIYLISALSLTVLVLLLRTIMEKKNILPAVHYQPAELPGKTMLFQAFLRTFAGCLLILPAVLLNCKFAAAPPLLVAFTEFCKTGSPAERKKPNILLFMSFCAVTGTLFRYLFSILLPLPICIPAMLSISLVLYAMKKYQLYLPPAGAITILAYLIPENTLISYPLQIFTGTAVLLFLSDFCRQKKKVPV